MAACIKENGPKNETGGPDPIPPKILSRDTLTTGGLWGINIGQNSADIYTNLQAMRVDRSLGGMGIVNNVYSSLEGLENTLPLYTSVFLDEAKGTSTGVQIGFADDKVKTIFNNNGVQFSQWPQGNSADARVTVGDPVTAVYQKLVKIKAQGTYANKFERISIFFKDMAKAYDPQMSASPQWYFVSAISEKRHQQLTLNFTAGKLVSIYSVVYE
ncbi:hypothetical protein BC343_20920 [Mucilaginibacter pedocola]|uniref:Uncharacterized protein n=1 Tax=Mucilaginibacter pedocola TaxID=1792845 RepID=A0A1S9PKF1_9SPHI|nr:hypothetical protein BC343_20920 [Mucilaginibacter pedocola]